MEKEKVQQPRHIQKIRYDIFTSAKKKAYGPLNFFLILGILITSPWYVLFIFDFFKAGWDIPNSMVGIVLLSGLGVGILLSAALIKFRNSLPKLLFRYFVNKNKRIYSNLITEKKVVSHYKEIIDKIQNTYSSIKIIIFFKKYLLWGITKNNEILLEGYVNKTITTALEILGDLQSDLLVKIKRQQESLESAKSEVESNIKGTTELDQVSELQRIRLDKQIEQFEELQRVLVKA